jgi:hypothetical protein
MRDLHAVLIMVLSLALGVTASADRVLSPTETADIIAKATNQARSAWITAGTIEATHQEYRAAPVTDPAVISAEVQNAVNSFQPDPTWTPEMQNDALAAVPFNVRYKLANEYTMSTTETIKYDGDKFYWEINLGSRTDSVTPDAGLNPDMTDEFRADYNQQRIFTWDGSKYTTFGSDGSGRKAGAVEDMIGKLPRAVNGPLTAGLFPWGRGKFKKDALDTAKILAKEISANGASHVELTITHADDSTSNVSLESSTTLGVTTATFEDAADRIVTYTCGDYRQVGSALVPYSISIRRQDRVTGRLLSADEWTITSLDTTVPAPDSFAVSYPLDTVVESLSPVDSETTIYSYAPAADTDDLLAQRLAYVNATGRTRQNCATAALENVASSFGKSIPVSTLAGLVGANGQTSLAQMKQAAQAAGLYARAVQADLAALQDLNGVKAILYLPGTKHFVVLNELDDQYIRLIDLSSKRFYYRQSADLFPREWTGIALLVSNRPIAGGFSDLSDGALVNIAGGVYMTCTKLFQNDTLIPCSEYPGHCSGAVVYYWKRYVCEEAASGSCSNSPPLIRVQGSPCLIGEWGSCVITGVWTYLYMSACK